MRKISDPVLEVLSMVKTEENRAILPGQLARADYEQVNKVLVALGGKWNRAAKAHVFPSDAGELIEGVLLTGTYETNLDTGWYPTPPDVVTRALELLRVEKHHSVLEPSCGEGAFVLPLTLQAHQIYAIELDEKRMETMFSRLSERNWGTFPPDRVHVLGHAGDFLPWEPGTARFPGTFDRIIMNPPYGGGREWDHLTKALGLLAEGGILVAVLPSGFKFRRDRKVEKLRNWIDYDCEDLPAGSFKSSGTDVNTCLVTFRG